MPIDTPRTCLESCVRRFPPPATATAPSRMPTATTTSSLRLISGAGVRLAESDDRRAQALAAMPWFVKRLERQTQTLQRRVDGECARMLLRAKQPATARLEGQRHRRAAPGRLVRPAGVVPELKRADGHLFLMTVIEVRTRWVTSDGGHREAISAALLGGVERSIGGARERFGVDSVVWGNSKAQRDGDALVDAWNP